MSRGSLAVIAVLVTATLLAGVVAAEPAATRGDDPAVGDGASSADGVTADLNRPDPRTIIGINVTRSGDATVAVKSRFDVNGSDENESQAFETLYRDVRDGDVALLYDASTMRSLVGDVSAATDREMAVENARWTRSVRNGTGVIALRFTWTNFGIDRTETVVVGDAFRTADGSWLPTLADGQRLVLSAPDGYTVLSPSDSVGEEQLTWDGPHQFQSGAPTGTFGGNETTPRTPPTPTTTGDGTTATTSGGPTEQSGSPLFWVVLLVAVLSVGGGGYWYFSEQDGGAAAGAASTADDDADPQDAAAVPVDDGADNEVDEDDEDDGDDGDDEDDGDDVAAGGIDPELLSDEERVEHLLEQNGGRMKQAQIVKETGWSNAKVSQLLSSMDEADRIDKLRIGRENLITLPDEDVTDM